MKTAVKKIVAIEIYCPKCDAVIVSPAGVLSWDVNELRPTVMCEECSTTFRTPKVAA